MIDVAGCFSAVGDKGRDSPGAGSEYQRSADGWYLFLRGCDEHQHLRLLPVRPIAAASGQRGPFQSHPPPMRDGQPRPSVRVQDLNLDNDGSGRADSARLDSCQWPAVQAVRPARLAVGQGPAAWWTSTRTTPRGSACASIDSGLCTWTGPATFRIALLSERTGRRRSGHGSGGHGWLPTPSWVTALVAWRRPRAERVVNGRAGSRQR